MERRAEMSMVRRAPRLTVISSFLERCALRLGADRRNVLRLPSGAPIDAIVPRDKEESRARLGLEINPGTVAIVYTANYHHDENFILRSVRAALDRTGDSRFLVFAVSPPFTPGNLVKHGVADVVHEVGRRPFSEMPSWLGAADLLLLPYPDTVFNRSRWPNKIGDYLAAGRPTVTNRTGDFVELFRTREIGITAGSSPEAYGQAIADAILARDRWGAWGATARKLAEDELSWEHLAKELEAFWLGDPAEAG
jgi:glycosyltransferase involved in cell wall biosynthesis